MVRKSGRPFRLILALLYFLFTFVLFVLPGSAFPQDDWLAAIYFDKWVHIGLFATLFLVANWALGASKNSFIALFLSVYGIMVELIQHYFVANRAFDVYDWLADLAGIGAGALFWKWVIKK